MSAFRIRTLCSLALLGFVAGAGGCVSSESAKTPSLGMVQSPSEETALEWTLTGSRIIGCCCATPCPCRMNYKPMHAHGCDSTTAVHIDKGEINGVKMDGMMWIITARGFAGELPVNWHHVYVSDKVTDEQYAVLKSMLEESMQGLGGKADYLAGKGLGIRKVPMNWTVSKDRREWTAEITGILTLKARSIVLPGRSQPVMTTGIFDDFGDKFIHADCLAHTYSDPQIKYAFDLTGRQCNQADFTLTSQQVARGGIGWACWSAHADLGDNKTQYQEDMIGHN